LPLVLVWQLPLAPFAGLAWDWANNLGYLGVAIIMLLFIYAGRPRAFPPFSGRFFANLHRDLGYLALLLVAAHVGLLLAAEPLLLEHLKPSAPLYMLAGLVATVLLLVLVVSSITALRRRIWPDYRRFRSLHAWLAIACAVLAGWHVAGSHFYLNTNFKLAVAGTVAIAVLAYYLSARRGARRRVRFVSRLRNTAACSHLLSYGATLLLVILALALVALRSQD
jgi:hypothetical protein